MLLQAVPPQGSQARLNTGAILGPNAGERGFVGPLSEIRPTHQGGDGRSPDARSSCSIRRLSVGGIGIRVVKPRLDHEEDFSAPDFRPRLSR